MAITGAAAAPITEKQPLTPHAQMNMCSLPSRPSVVIAVGIGKPIRKAGGAMKAKHNSEPRAVGQGADRVERVVEEERVADQQRRRWRRTGPA